MLITCNWHVFYYTLAHFFPDFRLNYFLLTLAHFARSTNHPHRHHGRHRWVSSTMPVLRHQKPYTRRLIPSIHSIRPGVIIAAASDHQPSLHLHQQATMMGAGAPSPLSVMPPTYATTWSCIIQPQPLDVTRQWRNLSLDWFALIIIICILCTF